MVNIHCLVVKNHVCFTNQPGRHGTRHGKAKAKAMHTTACHEAKVYLNLYWKKTRNDSSPACSPRFTCCRFLVSTHGDVVYPYLQMQRRSVAGWHWHGPVNATTHLRQSWCCFLSGNQYIPSGKLT